MHFSSPGVLKYPRTGKCICQSLLFRQDKNYTQQKKLRKLCLRGYDKIFKAFEDFLISQ